MQSNEKKNWKMRNKMSLSVVIVGAGVLMSAATGDPFETSKQLEVFTSVLQQVQVNYVDEIGAEQAVGSAIKGMLKELDPYTVYYPEDKIEDVRLLQTGEYGGVGCVIQKIDKDIYISDLNNSGPAKSAGIQVGDIIKKVGDIPIDNFSISDVSSLLKGTPDSEVKVLVERGGKEKAFTFNRQNIKSKAVPFYGMRNDGVGYLYLDGFTAKASSEVRNALIELKKKNPKGIILDLRGNGGGLLIEAVKIVSYFSDTKDTIVSTRGRGGEIQDVYRKAAKTLLPDLSLAVLVDDRSASASEIVAGAIQDLDRGVILGEKSFGKGLVQQIKPLPFGAQMKVTVAKYYTPSGRCIQRVNYDRDENGTRTKKPAQKEFATVSGRPVVDGDGIHPDSTLSDAYYPEFISAMSAKGLDLRYAANVLNSMEDKSPDDFELSQDQWAAFVRFLAEEEFNFESLGERKLKQLGKAASELDYLSEDDIQSLLKSVEQRKGRLLESQRSEITKYIEDYLVQKRFGLEGALQRSLHRDTQINTAASILLEDGTMNALLGVK
ncbi:MAG TPA: peptidase S41 [Cryomorphaceae bacterium]|nr:peptidase S41 [Cryomorphaceae bacterium]